MQNEAEVLPGLKSFATAELRSIPNVQVHQTSAEAAIVFEGSHQPEVFNQLRTVVAVYRVLHFAVPRPKALLGHQHFTALTAEIHRIRSANPSGAFSTFRISAAGSDSSVFRRLRAALAEHLHLTDSPDEADLLLRVRPALHRDGWEVLVRTTPRPLATRGYRLRDMRGALNATIAAVMVRQAGWAERVCNIACGTATLLIEWAAVYPGTQAIGVDTNREVLHMAAENAAAASVRPALIEADASALPFADRAFEVLLADLPWGQAVGA
ncbi:MAG: methyltransferase domain-containing protein, partial [Anaerolineae bacterium]